MQNTVPTTIFLHSYNYQRCIKWNRKKRRTETRRSRQTTALLPFGFFGDNWHHGRVQLPLQLPGRLSRYGFALVAAWANGWQVLAYQHFTRIEREGDQCLQLSLATECTRSNSKQHHWLPWQQDACETMGQLGAVRSHGTDFLKAPPKTQSTVNRAIFNRSGYILYSHEATKIGSH